MAQTGAYRWRSAAPDQAGRHSIWTMAAAFSLVVFAFSHRTTTRALRTREIPPGGPTPTTAARISGSGWKDLALGVYDAISSHRVLAIAAGVTFYSILAVFPAIAALVSLYGLFSDAGTIAGHLDQMSAVLPGGAIEVIRDQMTRVAAKPNGTLGVTFGISLIVALWSANAGVKALFDALNVVYDEQEERGFIKLNLISLAFTSGAILFLLLAMGAVVVLPLVGEHLGFAHGTELVIRVGLLPLVFIVITLALELLYRFGPSRNDARWRWISWGSAAAAAVWIAASVLFSWYAANFGTYNETYGSLGAVIGFMVWIWISAIVVLSGAELNVVLARRGEAVGVAPQ